MQSCHFCPPTTNTALLHPVCLFPKCTLFYQLHLLLSFHLQACTSAVALIVYFCVKQADTTHKSELHNFLVYCNAKCDTKRRLEDHSPALTCLFLTLACVHEQREYFAIPPVRPSFCPSIFFLESRGSSEDETWTSCWAADLLVKMRLWSRDYLGRWRTAAFSEDEVCVYWI